MKLGLLICDRVSKAFLEIQGDYPEMFQSLFPALECVPYYVAGGQFPDSVEECDAWLVGGSRQSVYDEMDWISDLKLLVREIYNKEKPYVGVCFGHQMLAEALGGKVEKSPEGWCVGVHQFEILKPEPWMNPFQHNFNLLMMCQDQVVQLPPNSTVLSQTLHCRIGIFKAGNTMLGIQAHPEFSKSYDQALFESRIDRIGREKAAIARDSLHQPVHRKMIAQWIVNFIQK